MLLQVCFIDIEKCKKILARNSLRVSPVQFPAQGRCWHDPTSLRVHPVEF